MSAVLPLPTTERHTDAGDPTSPTQASLQEPVLKTKLRLAAAVALAALAAGPTRSEDLMKDVPLIPRETLFGNPDHSGVQVSPDGKRLSWLAPVDGVMNVWVAPRGDLKAAKAVTDDRKRGIRSYFWSYDNDAILYQQDAGGDENFHLYRVDLASGRTKDLTPYEGVRVQVAAYDHTRPDTMIVGLNDRDAQFHDLYTLDLNTGERKLLLENEGFLGFTLDDDYRVRFAQRYTPDGGREILKKTDDGYEPFLKIDQDDALTTDLGGFTKDGRSVYMTDSRGRDTAALYLLDLDAGAKKLIAENDKADLSGAITHPTEKTLYAVGFNYLKNDWQILDDEIAPDLAVLEKLGGEIVPVDTTLDFRTWVVAVTDPAFGAKYYLYDRATKKPELLFYAREELKDLPLVEMAPVEIPSRDGLTLVSYLTLPKSEPVNLTGGAQAKAPKPAPMVLYVHGGPWARDSYGYNPIHQWLANRGYAVLSVNFRGSTGFGKNFLNAGNRQWAGKMHDDLIDAVDWAVTNGIAEKDKVGIMGGSYGGYATLVGLTFTPDVFACGVDIVGPSNIVTLLKSIPAYWAPAMQQFTTRVGDMGTEEGREYLASVSPLTFVDRIEKPLLIGQGANDPRVKQAEADQIVEAMTKKNIPVTYVLYPDEGHGFQEPANRMSFFGVTDVFLAEHLGGRAEAISGETFAGSSIQVPTGADEIPNLKAALGN